MTLETISVESSIPSNSVPGRPTCVPDVLATMTFPPTCDADHANPHTGPTLNDHVSVDRVVLDREVANRGHLTATFETRLPWMVMPPRYSVCRVVRHHVAIDDRTVMRKRCVVVTQTENRVIADDDVAGDVYQV